MFNKKSLLVSTLALAFASVLPAQADDWQHTFTPYVWAADMKVSVGGTPQSELDFFDDILPIVDAGWMSMYEARKNNWSFMNDIVYMKLSDGISATKSGPLGFLTANAAASGVLQQTTLDLLAGYTPDNSQTTVYAGLRYILLEVDASFMAAIPVGTLARSGHRDEDWVDPVIGVRHVIPLDEKMSITVQVDAGGGAYSEFSSVDTLTFNYAVSEDLTLRAGYRYARIDKDDDDLVFDQTSQGVLVGAAFSF